MIVDVEKGIECNKSDFREYFMINFFRIFLLMIRRVWVVNNVNLMRIYWLDCDEIFNVEFL